MRVARLLPRLLSFLHRTRARAPALRRILLMDAFVLETRLTSQNDASPSRAASISRLLLCATIYKVERPRISSSREKRLRFFVVKCRKQNYRDAFSFSSDELRNSTKYVKILRVETRPRSISSIRSRKLIEENCFNRSLTTTLFRSLSMTLRKNKRRK